MNPWGRLGRYGLLGALVLVVLYPTAILVYLIAEVVRRMKEAAMLRRLGIAMSVEMSALAFGEHGRDGFLDDGVDDVYRGGGRS